MIRRSIPKVLVLLSMIFAVLGVFTSLGSSEASLHNEEVYGPPPSGWAHRPVMEFFTGLSCPSCMGKDENSDSPEKAVHDAFLGSREDETVPFTTVVFHELNGGGVDSLNNQEATERMRFYQPGMSGTPDIEFDGGYVELGGFSTSTKSITKENVLWANDQSKTRYNNKPFRPLDRVTWSFPFIKLEVDQVFQDGQFAVVGKVTYDGNAKLAGAPQLQGSLYVFMVEDGVEAYSKVYDKMVNNDAVFRGYAVKGETFSLRNGNSWEFSSSWAIPDTEVPIRPQNIYAVAAVYDTQDTSSSASTTDGNMKGTPRCLQSATSDSTAYDRENTLPRITNATLDKDAVTVMFEDDGGIGSAVLFYNTEAMNATNWTSVPLELQGEELCDDAGVCYAFSDPSGTAKVDVTDGPVYVQVLANDDQMAQSRSEVFVLGGESSGTKEKGTSSSSILGGTGLLLAGIIVMAGSVLLYFVSRKKKGRLFGFFGSKGTMALFIFIGLIITFVGGATISTNRVTTVPDFQVTDTAGNVHTPASYEGKVLVLDLMFTTCSSCNGEMPEFVQNAKDIKNTWGGEVEFLSVSVDRKDTKEMMDAFQAKYGADWPIARDPSFIEKFDAFEVPKKVVIAPNGDIVYQHKGYTDGNELRDAVKNARNEKHDTSAISQSGGNLVATGSVAAVFGILTFFSPCSFPMLPGYFTYYIANQAKNRGKKAAPIKGGLYAAAGIVVFFILVGLLVAIFGVAIQSMLRFLMPFIGAILLIFGILTLIGKDQFLESFMELVKYPFHAVTSRFGSKRERDSTGSSGLFAYGFGYGAAASSCMAPVFLGVIFLGFAAGGIFGATFVFGLYALSIGSMMVIFSYLAASGGKGMERLISSTGMIKKISGLLLIFAGAFVLWYHFYGSHLIGGLLSF